MTVLFGEGLYLGILPPHGEEAGLLGLNLGGFFSIIFFHPLLSQDIIFAFGGSGVWFFSPHEFNVQELGWTSLYFTSAYRKYRNFLSAVLCNSAVLPCLQST